MYVNRKNMKTDETTKDNLHGSTASQIYDLRETFLQEIATLRNMLQQHEQHICELKRMSGGILVGYNDNENDESMAVTAASLKKSQVHPVVTTKRSAGPATTFLKPKPELKAWAKNVSAAGAATSHMAKLKDTKSYPQNLNAQYESALEKLYMKEFGGAIPEYEHARCCHRNQKRDEDSRKILGEIFPPYLFYVLLFTGTIPQRRKAYSIMTVAFWSFYLCFIGIWVGASVLTFLTYVLCTVDANCEISQGVSRFDYPRLCAFLLSNASLILSIIFAHTKFRDLLQSRAMMALISSVGTARIRKSTRCWMVFFIIFCVLTGFWTIYTTYNAIAVDIRYVMYLVLAVVAYAAPFAQVLVFFLMMRAMCLSYDDWTNKMLVATATPLEHSPEGRLIQLNLLRKLKALVSLCAVNTLDARVLLICPVLVALGICFDILSVLIQPDLQRLGNIIMQLLTSAIIECVPFVFALYFSWRMDILETVVAQANLRKISDYLQHAPKGWMIGQKTSLNFELLARTAGLLSLVMAFCTFYVQSSQQSIALPWQQQAMYEHFGTCTDGIRSGLEQHMDCGRPESSCPHTCREKYGEYILISPDRECTDVDGYVHITTQRACAAAHRAWARLNNRSGPVRHAVVHAGAAIAGHEKTWFEISDLLGWAFADWTGEFRCGAYTRPRVNWGMDNVPRFSFPALFSSGKTPSQYQKPEAYLCYAKRTHACQATGDASNFEEMMSCAAPVQHTWGNSAWRNISGPLPDTATTWSKNRSEVAEFRASRGRDGDCARIRVFKQYYGAQVVFTLVCNASLNMDLRDRLGPANASTRASHGISCPKDNISKISIESGRDIRSIFLVSSTPDMTNMTEYQLGSEPQNVVTPPGSTFALVVDRSSFLRSFTICF